MLRSTGNCGKCVLRTELGFCRDLALDAGGRKVSEVVLVYSLDILLSKAVHNLG